jgi:Ulp1 family protease
MHQCDEDDEDFRDEISNMHQAWQLSSASHKRVFVPINDQFNASRTAFAKPGGGSHWSLLLWTVSKNPSPSSIPSCTFYHFDSSSGYNTTAALAVSQKLMKVLYCGTKTDPIHIGAADVNECKTPQQCNAYDCGVFLLGFAEALSSAKDDFTPKYCKEKYEDTVSSFASRDEFAVKLRRRIYEDIRTLLASKI